MAVTREGTIHRFRGLSTDQKPGLFPNEIGEELQTPPDGSTFTESDTGRRYVYRGREWVRQEQTIEPLIEELIAVTRDVLAVVTATHKGHEEHLWEEDVDIEGAA